VGIDIATSCEIESVDQSADAVHLLGSGKRLGSFDLVIDASGARSKLRRFADHASDPRPLAYGAFWASLAWREGFDPQALSQRYDKASVMIGVLPIGRAYPGGGDMAAFFWSLKPADADRVQAAGIDAWKERIVALWPACEAFTRQIESFDLLTLARYGHHTMVLPAGRRLAVIGDAAHSTSPQLGQGANMALLDAAALAHALNNSSSVDDALDAYCRARRWHVRVFQALSWMFTPFYQSDSALLPFLRDRLVATVAKIPPVPQFLAAMVAGTVVDPFRGLGLSEVDWNGSVAKETAWQASASIQPHRSH
jgi:2-polyprenyl-6-methoxyphenol hydroxylase-like FAD-dependent oxidoreductase